MHGISILTIQCFLTVCYLLKGHFFIIMQWYISIPVKFCSSLRLRPCSEPRMWNCLCSLNPSPVCSSREKSHSPEGHSAYSHVHSPPSKLLFLSHCAANQAERHNTYNLYSGYVSGWNCLKQSNQNTLPESCTCPCICQLCTSLSAFVIDRGIF